MFVIGLTGGIGTGKSEVAKVLRKLGAEVIEADKVAHQSYVVNSLAWKKIVREFGEDFLTPENDVDRAKLGELVFRDQCALRRLNKIVHPETRRLIEKRLNEMQALGSQVVAVEVPLLLEASREDAGWIALFDEIWSTVSTDGTVIERVQKRSQLTVKEIKARVSAQVAFGERLRHSQVVIDNDGSLADLKQHILEIWEDRVVQSN